MAAIRDVSIPRTAFWMWLVLHLPLAMLVLSTCANLTEENPMYYTFSASTDTGEDDGQTRVRKLAVEGPVSACTTCFLVIGVKVSTLNGFRERQAIRATWAAPASLRDIGVRVVFLGCEPNFSARRRDDEITEQAIEQEKLEFGDLLTYELGNCVDSYYQLVEKSTAFFRWAAMHHPGADYVMVTDDDVYLRVDQLVAILKGTKVVTRRRFYAGQVWASPLHHPVRDESHKNFLSRAAYPMSQLLPFAVGPHYVLSIDLVQFLALNIGRLRGVGTLEDVSVAYWLFALLGVRPVDISVFKGVLDHLCHNSLISYAGLAQTTISHVHDSIASDGPLCRGFSFSSWPKFDNAIPTNESDSSSPAMDFTSGVHLDLYSRVVYLTVTIRSSIFTIPHVKFFPTRETFSGFCEKLQTLTTAKLPVDICDRLCVQFDTVLSHSSPANSALVTLARSNLPPLAVASAAVRVWISSRTLRWRAVIESLLANIYQDVHVFVVEETFARLDDFTPEIAVGMETEVASFQRLPLGCRLLLFGTLPVYNDLLDLLSARTGIVLLTPTRNRLFAPRRYLKSLYLPPASLVFADSLDHSPLTLLAPRHSRPETIARATVILVAECNRNSEVFTSYFQASIDKTKCRNHIRLNSTAFVLDTLVATYSNAAFTLIADNDDLGETQRVEALVAAFLAGSVPVYVGNSATTTLLFNRKAYIDCGSFSDIESCAKYVKAVSESSSWYESIRCESPVTNITVFREVFSWHSDVTGAQGASMWQDLKDLIDSI